MNLPTNKHISLEHLWDLIMVGDVNKEIVIEVIRPQKQFGGETYPLRYQSAYIFSTTEKDGAHGLTKNTNRPTTDLQQVLHCVWKINICNDITPKSEIEYDQKFIRRVNKHDPKY